MHLSLRKNVNKDIYMEFLRSGGFPELFHLNNFETKRNYISSIKDTVLLRDIVQRNNIKDARLLEEANLLRRAERYDIKGKDIISGTCKYYVNDLAFHNYLYNGYG